MNENRTRLWPVTDPKPELTIRSATTNREAFWCLSTLLSPRQHPKAEEKYFKFIELSGEIVFASRVQTTGGERESKKGVTSAQCVAG
jgi:hypothetical protein